MLRILRFLEAAVVVILSFPLAILPYRTALKAGKALGLFAFYAWADRRKIAIANIEKSIQAGALQFPGQLSPGTAAAIARESFVNLGKCFAEVIKIYFGFGDDLINKVVIKGAENYSKAHAKGRGVIFLTGHCGNWELMALAFGVKIAPVSVVARPQDNPYLDRIIAKVRVRHGNGVIYKKGALKGILSCLKKGGCVGILMDQAVLKDEGFVIDFLGRGAWTTRMPALIARKTGTPVLPIFINREGAGHVVTIHPEVSLRLEEGAEAVKEDTAQLSGYVEDYIRRYPSEWLWIHRRWKRVE